MAKIGWQLMLDFDSTLVRVEAWDELAKIIVKHQPEPDGLVAKIEDLTRQAMTGSLAFESVLRQRLKLLGPGQMDIDQLVTVLRQRVTDSAVRRRAWLKRNASRIWVVSGGFSEFILPVVCQLGLRSDQVLANKFDYDGGGRIIGFQAGNPLLETAGKAQAVKQLELTGEIVMVGDGMSDYLVRHLGAAGQFWLFTENVMRQELVAVADRVMVSFDEVVAELTRMGFSG